MNQLRKQGALFSAKSKRLTPYLWPLVLTILVGLIALSIFNQYLNQQQLLIRKGESLAATAISDQEMISHQLRQTFKHIESGISVLAKNEKLRFFSITENPQTQHVIEDQWLLLAEKSGLYTQIRYIDINGYEKIRINYDPSAKTAQVSESMQFKGDRPFMRAAEKLHVDGVVIGTFGLDHEYGEYVKPYQLEGRAITPVTTDNQITGYVVFDLDMNKINELLAYPEKSSGIQLQLLSEDGFYLYSANSGQNFGHLISQRKEHNLSKTNPFLWQLINSKEFGSTRVDGGHLIHRWINLDELKSQRYRINKKILFTSWVTKSMIANASKESLEATDFAWEYQLFIILLASILGGILGRKWLTQLKTQKLVLTALSQMSAVMIVDDEFRIIGVNSAFANITGIGDRNCTGMHPSELELFNTDMNFWQGIQNDIDQKGRWQGEFLAGVADAQGKGTMVRADINAVYTTKESTKGNYYVVNLIDISERAKLEQRLLELSYKDPLTGAYNRRHFAQEMARQCNTSERYQSVEFSLAILDIDHFKKINDAYGHDEGDRVLKQFVAIIAPGLRLTDTMCRIGGEEFAVLLPHTNQHGAMIVAQRLQGLVRQAHSVLGVTCSIGIAQWQAGMKHADLYKAADGALYQAKEQGRNRIVIAESAGNSETDAVLATAVLS